MKEYSFEIKKTDAGARIDKWLTKALNRPRNQVKSLLDNGRVLVNSRRVVIAGWELEQGDHVVVKVIPERPKEKTVTEKSQREAAPIKHKAPPEKKEEKVRVSALRNIGKPTLSYEKLRSMKKEESRPRKPKKARAPIDEVRPSKNFLKIYYQDKDLMVVEKLAGLLTVPQKGSNHPHMVGLIQSFLRRKYKQSKYSFVKPLHRLDKETSGVMVFATSRAGEKLSIQFKKHAIDRKYFAAVHGTFEEENGKIDAPLEKGDFGRGKKVRLATEGDGKMARTFFSVRERYKNATYLDVSVSTGRTHQVRVHFASRGNPLIGDKLYSDHRKNDIPFSRHALHAYSLGFKHPVSGKKFLFKSPVPGDMKKLIDDLRMG